MSKRITAENVTEVGGVVRRQVTVWDNLHANDYDQTRLYLGPYSGRPTELLDCLRGVLTNPNCEFEANFVALHTLAQWSTNKVTRFPVERQGWIHICHMSFFAFLHFVYIFLFQLMCFAIYLIYYFCQLHFQF